MAFVLDNPLAESAGGLVDLVKSRMSPADFIGLNGGNTLKVFLDPRVLITDRVHYAGFKAWFGRPAMGPYIKQFGLGDLAQAIHESVPASPVLTPDACREFIVYNAYTQFIKYLESPTYKHHDILYDLASPRHKWLNPKYRQLIVLERVDDEIHAYCPKYTGINASMDLTQTFVFVLKQGAAYEPVVQMTVEKGGTREDVAFTYIGSGRVRRLIDFVRKSGCRSEYDDAKAQAKEIRAALISFGYSIRNYVINTGFKLTGFIVERGTYVPLETPCPFHFNGAPVRYKQTLHKLRGDADYALKAFKSLGDHMTRKGRLASIYGVVEDIVVDDRVVALRLGGGEGIIVPIHLKDRSPLLEDDALDEALFAQGVLPPADSKDAYGAILVKVVRAILMSKDWSRRLHIIKHDLNPLPESQRLESLADLIKDMDVKGVTGAFKALLVEDLYQKDLRFILRQRQVFVPQPGEIVADQYDIIRNFAGLDGLQNAFQYGNSIEDHVSGTESAPVDDAAEDEAASGVVHPEWDMWKRPGPGTGGPVTEEITPVRVRTLLCGKKHAWVKNVPYLSSSEVRDIFMIVADLKGALVDGEMLEDYLQNAIANEYEDDSAALISELSLNDSFGNKAPRSLDLSPDTIFDKRMRRGYHYGIYELRKLAAYVGVNLVIVGRKQERLVEGQLFFDNRSRSYLVFFVSSTGEPHLIIDPVHKRFLFGVEDMSELPKSTVTRIVPK
jgi:hypothetical protein